MNGLKLRLLVTDCLFLMHMHIGERFFTSLLQFAPCIRVHDIFMKRLSTFNPSDKVKKSQRLNKNKTSSNSKTQALKLVTF